MNNYPTENQILKKKPYLSKKIIKAIMIWKKLNFFNWSKKNKKEKIIELQVLILMISIIVKRKMISTEETMFYAYDPIRIRIFLNKNNPSILSTLHELGHYLYGPSELTACRWSVWIFKECFPELFKNLRFEGHLLVKK